MHRSLTVLVLALPLAACQGGNCGTADFVTAGTALELWDLDGDGRDVDLMEPCGYLAGSYGLRRDDLGLTTLLFTPDIPGATFAENLQLSDYLLPIASVTFYTRHLQPGAVIGIDKLAGGGLSKLAGTSDALYDTYPLLDATITVLDGPQVPKDIVSEMNNAARWRLRWTATFGDSNAAYQTWDAEDRVEITDGTEIGDEDFPPDWTGADP